MLNILKIKIYLLFMHEKGDENYVNFLTKKSKYIYLFISCKNKYDKNYVENFHKNHNLIDLLVMQKS
jgi:hypothetical protein